MNLSQVLAQQIQQTATILLGTIANQLFQPAPIQLAPTQFAHAQLAHVQHVPTQHALIEQVDDVEPAPLQQPPLPQE